MMSLVIAGLAKKLRTLVDEQGTNGRLMFDVSIINKWLSDEKQPFELSVDRVTGKLVVINKEKVK